MPTLDSPQFKDYAFRVRKHRYGTTASVARRDEKLAYTEPLGSLDINTSRDVNENNQKNINQDPMYTSSRHDTDIDLDTGQRRWSGGNFESDAPYVGWAGMKDVPGKSRLMQGMAAVLVHEHGSMPAADSTLSESGARLARGVARKYGMKGSGNNQQMEGQFESMDEDVQQEAEYAWSRAAPSQRPGLPVGKEYSAATTAAIVRDMDDQYRLRPKKTNEHTSVLHPDQMKLL